MLTRENYIDRMAIGDALRDIITDYFADKNIEQDENLLIDLTIENNEGTYYTRRFRHQIGVNG